MALSISIAVCTRNRAHSILRTLDAIEASARNAACDDIQLVVVDNGSTDDTAERVRQWATRKSLNLNLVIEPNPGVSKARNAALRTMTGNIIAFTDDDCLLHLDYIAKLSAIYARDKTSVLRGGRVHLGDPTDLPVGIRTANTLRRWSRIPGEGSPATLTTAIIGANLTMSRATAQAVGYFDDRFGPGGCFSGGEEIDFIYRAYLLGIPVEYNPALAVDHFHGRKTNDGMLRHLCRYDIADGALCAKYAFTSIPLFRAVWWDLRKALKEPLGGPPCRTSPRMSHWLRLWSLARGFVQFSLLALPPKPARARAPALLPAAQTS
jgi:glycosyltransferase involved in cell wall biosynthesis